MTGQNKHWQNRVQVVRSVMVEELAALLNTFYKNKFVIATQVFPPGKVGKAEWIAIVYFKVKPRD